MPNDEPYFAKYLRCVPLDSDPIERLALQSASLLTWLRTILAEDSLVLHAPYTWSFRQVIQHLNDCERVFAFRLLWMARGETAPLESFDEMRFSSLANPNRLEWGFLLDEFESIRKSSVHLLMGLDASAWDRTGVASGYQLTVRILADMLFGHVEHHARIMRHRILG